MSTLSFNCSCHNTFDNISLTEQVEDNDRHNCKNKRKYKTVPMAVQYLKGGYGSVDMGAMMGTLVLAIVPIIIFYLFCQRYIIEGVVAGAVKG